MLKYETITASQKRALEYLAERGFFEQFYLAGGTGLSLQIGHRESVDIDLFSATEFEVQEILVAIGAPLQQEIVKKNTVIGVLDDVRVSFFYFPYQMIQEVRCEGKIRIAGMEDIAAMKVNAIMGRGGKKDFFDLYCIIRHTKADIEAILDMCARKFPGFQRLAAVKALCYFEDADSETLELPVRVDVPWKTVKEYFIGMLGKTL